MKAIRILFLLAMIFMVNYAFAIPKLVGTFVPAGHGEWDTADSTMNMTSVNDTIYTISLDLPVATYLYKVLDGVAWTDPNYPGNNQTIDVTTPTTVTWTCNNVARLVMHTLPVVAGNFFTLLGGENWNASSVLGQMVPHTNPMQTYTWEALIPAGTYEFKITLNGNWDQNTTTNNIPFVSDGVTATLITYNFNTNVITTSAGAPPSATVTFTVNDQADQTHTALYLKGSWNANGNYDPTWGNGMEHITLADDGQNGDAVAGDHILTAVQYLVTDAGSNTWSWGVNDENHAWVDATYATFTLPTADPQTMSVTLLGGTAQEVTVTFKVDMAGGDAAIFAGGVSVQGNVLPLDWTNGSHMMMGTDNLYILDVVFPAGSIRNVQYKYGAFDISNVWTWESSPGNHTFTINDSFAVQVLPIDVFFPVSNNDPATSVTALKLTNYPNPFVGNTTISYEISKRGLTTVEIYNLKGQLVRTLVNEDMEKGLHQTTWDANDNDGKKAANGMYFFKLRNNGSMVGKKVILLK